MTETPIISGEAPPTDSGVGMLPSNEDSDAADGGNRRRLMIIGTVAGLIILAAAAYLLLHKSPSSTPTSGAVPRGVVVVHHTTPAKSHTAAKGAKKTKSVKVVKVAHGPQVVDPFAPLVTAPVATTGAPASSSTVTSSSTAPSTAPSTGTQPVTTPSTGTTTTTGTGKTAGGPLWIQLMSASGQTAHFKVGYAHHKFRDFTVLAPKASSDQGTVFAHEFALISVQSGQATIQIGDGAPFILTTGVSHVA
jgi:hypothetical protein